MPKSGLATGTPIQNQAVVVFDTNAPIATPTWLNTIDRDPPVTHVLPLASTQSSPNFAVQWRGIDAGSGIRASTILVSDTAGPRLAGVRARRRLALQRLVGWLGVH